MYVFIESRQKTEGGSAIYTYTVGSFEGPNNKLYPIKDCASEEMACRLIHFLNGGTLYDEWAEISS